MTVRYLGPEDIPEHDKVASQAFVGPCEIGDPASVLPCEKVLGAFDDDGKTLFADLEVHEKLCRYDGGLLTCAGVGGVAAKPEHRGKGAVRALFETLFNEKKYDISILYPFSESYYGRLGYARAGVSLSASVPFSALAGVERNSDAVLYEGRNTRELLALYGRCSERYNLCFVRNTAEEFSDRPYLSQSYTYIWKDRSFATFSVDRAKSTVFVRELFFDSPESMLGIVGFLRCFEANQKTVCFENLPENTPLLRCVSDMRACDVRLRGVGAVRVLDFEKVLRAHRYPGGTGAFTLKIGDETYRTEFSENGVTVEKNGAREPDAVMGVACASRLLLCGIPDEPYFPDLRIIDPGSDFFRAFPPKTTFFTDSL